MNMLEMNATINQYEGQEIIMAWISVHEMIDGPKLRSLYKKLNCSKFEALGILNFLWFWGLQNADKEGKILYADEEDIERYLYGVGAGCDISFRIIVEALFETGWIDRKEEGMFIHDWDVWQKEWYKLQERLKADAERKREKREKDKAEKAEPIEKAPEEEKDEKKSAYSKEFEEFWEMYPKKRDKGNANKAYNARRKEGWTQKELLQATENYAMECRNRHTEQQYIKNGATFLSSATPFIDFIRKNEEQENSRTGFAQPDMSNPFRKIIGE